MTIINDNFVKRDVALTAVYISILWFKTSQPLPGYESVAVLVA